MNPLYKLSRLSGSSINISDTPTVCQHCGDKNLYYQPDFKRSLGITFISVASLATFVLLYLRASWLTTWSPMFIALFVDRYFSWVNPLAVLCYKCGGIHRGLSKELCLKHFAPFDLLTHDRLRYAESTFKQ